MAMLKTFYKLNCRTIVAGTIATALAGCATASLPSPVTRFGKDEFKVAITYAMDDATGKARAFSAANQHCSKTNATATEVDWKFAAASVVAYQTQMTSELTFKCI
jgi:hypothetical protein